jgi:hypothetical protein
MTNTADKNSDRRGTGGASAPGSNERPPPRTPSKTDNAEIDKEDRIKEREDLSEDLSDDELKRSD